MARSNRSVRSSLLTEVDRRPAIPMQRSHDAWTWLDWMPDLDDRIRAIHEKAWGLMALAGAVIAGGATLIASKQPEQWAWLAVLLGAFGGVLLLPLLAILVRLSVFLVLAGLVGGAVFAGVQFFSG